MTDIYERPATGRFGAAAPGARPDRPTLEELLTAPAPSAGRRRRVLTIVAVVLAVLAVAAAGFFGGRLTVKTPPPPVRLMITSAALAAGASLTSADLQPVQIPAGARAPAGSLSPAAAAGLIGMVTQVSVPAGTFLTRALVVSRGAVPTAAQALVGVALRPGQLPAGGLLAGEHVLVVLVPSTAGAPASQLIRTTVWQVQGSAGQTLASVIVPAALATRMAGYAARGELALVATAPGSQLSPAAAAGTPASSPSGSSSHKAGTKPSHRRGTKPSTSPSHHG